MLSSPLDSPVWLSSKVQSLVMADYFSFRDVSVTPNASNSQSHVTIPQPPPPPPPSNQPRFDLSCRIDKCCSVPKEAKDVWDKLFSEGIGADVRVLSRENEIVLAHSTVLSVASPVLGNTLQQLKPKDGFVCIKIPGVSHRAVCAFLRFLYSSCYEEEEMEKFVLHLLVLSHSYSVTPLKNVCVNFLEHNWLDMENVIDVLQLAKKCDAPRLSLICVRLIVKNFKTVASTEGWKVMKRVDPALEQEILEYVVEFDTRKEERLKKIEEKKVYLQLAEVMEAMIHICRDGCRSIGPRDKLLKVSQPACNYPACKGLESLIRHFSICKTRVPGGCTHCKRMWQLLELHSRMCDQSGSCKVPLCRHFKEKMGQQSKKDETKWKVLVSKVQTTKNMLGKSRG
ncbi:BTB/POZ and TAZ domain-containing protein 3 [Impatiens glandulifera]|uniref:BTB/POZ and TAZ domain-containing protein 3 n=1 Tax=Impatiens glandulifera TaxID=253017 RepID=UPI001FB1868C|nr:BTB/POZ and TAZ domain-containing protein 3 [Impatiens glandulifera]